MNQRLKPFCLALLAAAVWVIPARAQTTQITVQTDRKNAPFTVDGVLYRDPKAFVWQNGSVHVLAVPYDYAAMEFGVTEGTRLTFTSWSTVDMEPVAERFVVVVPDGTPRIYTASFVIENRVRVVMGSLTANPASCSGFDQNWQMPIMGNVSIGGPWFHGVSDSWVPKGTVLTLSGAPCPGYLFTGWGLNGNPVQPMSSVVVDTPTYLYPTFIIAKHVKFVTEPRGLAIAVDGQEVATSATDECLRQVLPWNRPDNEPNGLCIGEVDLMPGARHSVSVVNPMRNREGYWVWDSWSNGEACEFEFDANDTVPVQWTATFVPGIPVVVATNPRNLAVKVDGVSDSSMKTMFWGIGQKHVIEAPFDQVHPNGRKYSFRNWSNDGPAVQQIVLGSDAPRVAGITFQAQYESTPRVTLQSSAGGSFTVDGAQCASPCAVDRPAGSSISVNAPSAVQISEVSRGQFSGWRREFPGGLDSSSGLTLTFDRDFQLVIAQYATQNKLVTSSEPGGGVDFIAEPAPSDGYLPEESEVRVTAKARNGFKFRRWEGDAQGISDTAWMSMRSPRFLHAVLDRVPYIADAGVRNAACDTMPSGVAAGSLISIVGESLALEERSGPVSPLAAKIADVVVQMEDRVLPLASVSPQKITALLPSDVPEGAHKLTVHLKGYPDVEAEFVVTRNAPGLFSNRQDTTDYAVALHEDGTPVTTEKPARHGEQVTFLGTGFGPFDKRPVDGFALPDRPVITLVDKVEMACDELRVSATWAGATSGRVGITSTKVRVPTEMESGNNEIRVTVNGVDSNAVVLPVE